MDWNLIVAGTPAALLPGVEEIRRVLPHWFQETDGLQVHTEQVSGMQGFQLKREGDAARFLFGEGNDFFRGLATIASLEHLENLGGGQTHSGESWGDQEEIRKFRTVGAMLDLSRNAVLSVNGMKRMLRQFALMGMNCVWMYMEDVYDLPGHPGFGYGRGKYSKEELKTIDAYAAGLGIELIPCIQTLGHLAQVLQWPAYHEIVDVPGVLLVGHEKTEAIVRDMIKTVSDCFRARKIHIGMDEAHGVGQGRYRKLNGDVRAFDVLQAQLQLVCRICKEAGLAPMMWSDMFFRIGSKNNEYYDLESVIPEDVKAGVPDDVSLVYWDYYHKDVDFYREYIRRHESFGKKPIFAAGIWNWSRLWTAMPQAMATMDAGLEAAAAAELEEVVATAWGDDGAECNLWSTLPAYFYFADRAYGRDPQGELAVEHACSCAQIDLRTYWRLGEMDSFETSDVPYDCYPNYAKWILWQDPLLAHLSRLIPENARAMYLCMTEDVSSLCGCMGPDAHLDYARLLLNVLSDKILILTELRQAIRERNEEALLSYAHEILPDIIQDMQALRNAHYESWHDFYKPFGWEVMELRYATQIARLQTTQKEIQRILDEPDYVSPCFEFEPWEIHPPRTYRDTVISHLRAASPSVVV